MSATVLGDVVGGGYGDFWRSRARYRVVKGGKGCKKSSTAALWYIVNMMKYPGANVLVVRRTMRSHLDSTFAQLKWAIRRLGVEAFWEERREPLMLRYKPTGQRILFRGMEGGLGEGAAQVASATVEAGHLCWVWVEEAFEIESEELFDRLDLSAPRGAVLPPLFKQTTLTFNPWNERHWLKGRFFDRAAAGAQVFSVDYRCNEFLDTADLAVFEAMRERHPRRYAVAGLGEWGITEGLVFEDWELACFERTELAGLRHVFGLDYGYAHDPTAFIAAAVDEAGRRLYIYDEHYATGMLNGDIARMVVQKGYGKERIRADAAEPKSNEELRRLGLTRVLAAVKGADSVRSGIARLQGYHMIVHPRCVHTAAELAAYVWSEERGADGRARPVDRENHLMDALRYAMNDAPVAGRQSERGTYCGYIE